MPPELCILTIGHSTRPLGTLIELLQRHSVALLADVRRFPASRTQPQFNRESLPGALREAGIGYAWHEALGGRRRAAADSHNTRWRNASFRGYADYMQTPAFAAALKMLMEWSSSAPTAIMCAEAVWWQCHRKLIADALVARGIEVRHIMSAKAAPAHALTEFARTDGERVTYPGLI
jgi:uncharacterized protein (DUF488 family)